MKFELTTFVVIGTDCTCSCKSNYHTITTAPKVNVFVNVTGLLKKNKPHRLYNGLSVLASSAVNHGLGPRSGQTKD